MGGFENGGSGEASVKVTWGSEVHRASPTSDPLYNLRVRVFLP